MEKARFFASMSSMASSCWSRPRWDAEVNSTTSVRAPTLVLPNDVVGTAAIVATSLSELVEQMCLLAEMCSCAGWAYPTNQNNETFCGCMVVRTHIHLDVSGIFKELQ